MSDLLDLTGRHLGAKGEQPQAYKVLALRQEGVHQLTLVHEQRVDMEGEGGQGGQAPLRVPQQPLQLNYLCKHNSESSSKGREERGVRRPSGSPRGREDRGVRRPSGSPRGREDRVNEGQG